MTEEPPAETAPTPGYGAAAVMLLATAGLAAALVALPNPPAFLTFAFVIAGWIVSVVVHEFGHAWVAYVAGDHTVVKKGYLSLDPRKYGDLGTTLVIPLLALALGGIGFPGGAVYLRNDLMRNRWWRAGASLAGPAGTLIVLIALTGLLLVARLTLGTDAPLVHGLAFLAFLQATALILNLLPVPGLDGYGAIQPFLPRSIAVALRPVERWAILALLALIFFVPGVSGDLFRVARELTLAVGVPIGEVAAGYEAFRFWE